MRRLINCSNIFWFIAAPRIVRLLSNAKSTAQVLNIESQVHSNTAAHWQPRLPAIVEARDLDLKMCSGWQGIELRTLRTSGRVCNH